MPREGRLLALAALVCAALAFGIAARDLECPGLYYDEVIQAEPALWFLRAEIAPPEIPGQTHARLFGRPFPVMTQAYMGALKSQVLVPVFALAGADARILRLTTLSFAVLGLCFAIAFAQRLYDLPTAVLLGALLAVDPSLLFIGRHDWGSFSLGLLLRCFALLALYSGWRARSAARLFAGGLAAGLAIYNKIDAGVAIVATGLALVLSAPGWLRELRGRGAQISAAVAGLVLGAAPVLLGVIPTFLTIVVELRKGASLSDGQWDLPEKVFALWFALDGSYFERLMRVGGSFLHLKGQGAATTSTPLPALFALACLALSIWIALDLRRGRPTSRLRFPLLAALFSFAGLLATPEAIRVHHFLNAWPFPQLVVAVAMREAWRRFESRHVRRVARAGVALAFAAALLGALRADLATLEVVRSSCGKARWSDAITGLVPMLTEQHLQAVCLDWGFGAQMRFTSPEVSVVEPVWTLRTASSAEMGGDQGSLYVMFGPDHSVYPFGLALLGASTSLPPDAVRIQTHLDRNGEPAFVSLRFTGPHRLIYRDGRFEVQMR